MSIWTSEAEGLFKRVRPFLPFLQSVPSRGELRNQMYTVPRFSLRRNRQRVKIEYIAKGSYGTVWRVTPNPPKGSKSLVVKLQVCDKNFEIELKYLLLLSRVVKMVPHIPYILYGEMNSRYSYCYMVMPLAQGTLDDFVEYDPRTTVKTFEKHLVLLTIQCVISIYLVHALLHVYHCDTHSENFFVFNTPRGIRSYTYRIDGFPSFTLPNYGKTIALYDFGLVNFDGVPKKRVTTAVGCRKWAFDYYRLFSVADIGAICSDSRHIPEVLLECRRYIVKVLGGKPKRTSKRYPADWEFTYNRRNPSSFEIFSNLMTILLRYPFPKGHRKGKNVEYVIDSAKIKKTIDTYRYPPTVKKRARRSRRRKAKK